jgi:hypothetical protein
MSERFVIGDVQADFILSRGGATDAEPGRAVERTEGGALRLYDGSPIRIEIPEEIARVLGNTNPATTS